MDETKTASGRRTLPLPRFAIEALTERASCALNRETIRASTSNTAGS